MSFFNSLIDIQLPIFAFVSIYFLNNVFDHVDENNNQMLAFNAFSFTHY